MIADLSQPLLATQYPISLTTMCQHKNEPTDKSHKLTGLLLDTASHPSPESAIEKGCLLSAEVKSSICSSGKKAAYCFTVQG